METTTIYWGVILYRRICMRDFVQAGQNFQSNLANAFSGSGFSVYF